MAKLGLFLLDPARRYVQCPFCEEIFYGWKHYVVNFIYMYSFHFWSCEYIKGKCFSDILQGKRDIYYSKQKNLENPPWKP